MAEEVKSYFPGARPDLVVEIRDKYGVLVDTDEVRFRVLHPTRPGETKVIDEYVDGDTQHESLGLYFLPGAALLAPCDEPGVWYYAVETDDPIVAPAIHSFRIVETPFEAS